MSKNKSSQFHFIITGGTIDSFYDGTIDTVRPNEKSTIPSYIKSLKLYEDVEFSEICMKDSRELGEDDMEAVLEAIEKSSSENIIVTHGTYTMPDTARFLQANLKKSDKRILLTGSMIPMSGFTGTDGPFNLGFSMASAVHLPAGIYVCMNGKVFTHDEAAKSISEGRFYSIFKGKEAEFDNE
ncbi:asparaginase [Candidatus Peregrinibacteria bacterium]|jgi:L-asparaginase|nr:asparaginase [Candidatus Peregrinibacteria bacterium]MBT7736977.1 asparaginase [Candidatus Peregrinibacteria bacterium]